jgi:hypothetical protein
MKKLLLFNLHDFILHTGQACKVLFATFGMLGVCSVLHVMLLFIMIYFIFN